MHAAVLRNREQLCLMISDQSVTSEVRSSDRSTRSLSTETTRHYIPAERIVQVYWVRYLPLCNIVLRTA
jgi:hypothetical protein